MGLSFEFSSFHMKTGDFCMKTGVFMTSLFLVLPKIGLGVSLVERGGDLTLFLNTCRPDRRGQPVRTCKFFRFIIIKYTSFI